ncbi:hypothetical protein [uncultured Secundilactobacillus sp.]|uniref:hypothetical protein n=1 Tax=uncultured Secundilactobacillus sp. TaxID=2813935 RepID=UPI0025825BE7|nr:hypothetical protein [uncultured Secundilactobacillus sp.]
MHVMLMNAQLALYTAQDKALSQHLLAGDAVSNTQSILKKILKALQVVGFAGGMAIGAGCFIGIMFAGQRGRDAVKSHLGWLVVGIIGLFAVAGFATLFKNYSTSSFGGG